MPYDETVTWMLMIVCSSGAVVLISALIYNRGICRRHCNVYTVDDQQIGSVLIFFMQLVDLYSDIILFIQYKLYHNCSKGDDQFPDNISNQLNWLFILSLGFVAVPYFGNLASSMGVIQSIANDKVMSGFTKKYFQNQTKLYSLLVLLSGGSIRSLKLMSSNLLGISKFSSGLSSLQIQQFRAHHLIGTVLMENIPQLAMQGFFMFHLGVYTDTVLISFISSVINVVLSIKTEITQCLANQNLSESPFTIFLSWNRDGLGSENGVSPRSPEHSRKFHQQTGRRKALSEALSAINYDISGALTIEIMTAESKTGGTMLYGVIHFDGNVDSAKGIFDRFKSRKSIILKEIKRIFDLEAVTKSLSGHFAFDIEINQSSGSSRAEKVDLAMELLNELDVDRALLSQVETAITGATNKLKSMRRTVGTKNVLTLYESDGEGVCTDCMHSMHSLNVTFIVYNDAVLLI